MRQYILNDMPDDEVIKRNAVDYLAPFFDIYFFAVAEFLRDQGRTVSQIARDFKVSKRTIQRWLNSPTLEQALKMLCYMGFDVKMHLFFDVNADRKFYANSNYRAQFTTGSSCELDHKKHPDVPCKVKGRSEIRPISSMA